MSLNTPTDTDIQWLFDIVYPKMNRSPDHRDTCIYQLTNIQLIFKRYKNDANTTLQHLTAIPGIGLTIASCLIFSANTDSMVPFDQFTMGYSLELKILKDANISDNYDSYSQKIIQYIQKNNINTILDFVIEAGKNSQYGYPPEG